MLLRFSNDNFMEELMGLLVENPKDLVAYRAYPEVWSGKPEDGSPLKLYQPAHQRYYLVATNLVCRRPGLPDRVLAPTKGEKTSFVVRRLQPIESDQTPTPVVDPGFLDGFEEYAFVVEVDQGVWRRVGPPQDPTTRDLLPKEQQHPLFGVGYQEETKLNRRLLAGLIPVGNYENYLGAPLMEDQVGSSTKEADTEPEIDENNDPRMAYLQMQVIAPWRSLKKLRENTERRLGNDLRSNFDEDAVPDGSDEISKQDEQLKRQLEMSSWYILLDLADFLETYDTAGNVLGELNQLGGVYRDLATSLAGVVNFRECLESAMMEFDEAIESALAYPPGEDAVSAYYLNSNSEIILQEGWPKLEACRSNGVAYSLADTDFIEMVNENGDLLLVNLIRDALKDQEADQDAPALPLAARQAALAAKTDLGQDAWFIIRCVFDRPRCVGAARKVVSAGTQPFQMASYFDPEAPSRSVRISLPLDTSPAGLRKFSKNTAFVLSDILACQIGQVQDITLGDLVLSVLPWPFHKPLPDPEEGGCSEQSGDGLVCSLSIPIVTICALLLLIIIAKVLDYFFRWIPYLIACFPLPGLKGKEKT